jgi:hypothetical protein
MPTIKNAAHASFLLPLIKKNIRTWAFSSFWKFSTPLIKLAARKNNVYITCSRFDGGGAQWHARLSTMAFCNAFGLKYIHSEIDELLPRNLPKLRKKWDEIIQISPLVQSPVVVRKIQVTSPWELVVRIMVGSVMRFPLTIQVQHCHFYTDFSPGALENALSDLDFRYRNSERRMEESRERTPTLAIHFRRGHMHAEDQNQRHTTFENLLANINFIVQSHGPVLGTVYCAFEEPGLEALLPPGFTFESSLDEFEVLDRLINADYLLMAKSSMSYIAAVLSTGKVFYEPFWHPPLSQWIRLPHF